MPSLMQKIIICSNLLKITEMYHVIYDNKNLNDEDQTFTIRVIFCKGSGVSYYKVTVENMTVMLVGSLH